MRLLPLSCLVFVSLCFACPLQGAIEIEAVGQPIDGNSWSQGFRFRHGDNEPKVDLVSFHMNTPDGRFKGKVAVSQFSRSSWREAYKSDRLASAVGDCDWPELDMLLSFEDDRKDMECTVLLFEQGRKNAYQEVFLKYSLAKNHWKATVRDRVYLGCSRSDVTSVPEPTTLAIWSAFGALGLITARRRRKVA